MALADSYIFVPGKNGPIKMRVVDSGDGATYALFATNDASATLYAGTYTATGTGTAIAASQAVREVICQNDPDSTTTAAALGAPGSGGGGGGGHAAGAGGAGSAGTVGGGGGGGGGCVNANASGAGGAGGPGYVRIYAW